MAITIKGLDSTPRICLERILCCAPDIGYKICCIEEELYMKIRVRIHCLQHTNYYNGIFSNSAKVTNQEKRVLFLPCIAPQKETLGGREKVLLSSIKGLDSVWNAYSAVALTLDIKCAASTRNTIPPASGKNSTSFDLNCRWPGTSSIRTVFSFSFWNKNTQK